MTNKEKTEYHFLPGFYSYGKTYDIAKQMGVMPDYYPNETTLKRVQDIIIRCMAHYRPLPGDSIVKGVFIYNSFEQAGSLRNSFGCSVGYNDKDAIIGLSYDLLNYDMPVFHDLVFIHELAHMTDPEHDEAFQNRFNELEFDYYFYNEVRADGIAQSKPIFKGWKM